MCPLHHCMALLVLRGNKKQAYDWCFQVNHIFFSRHDNLFWTKLEMLMRTSHIFGYSLCGVQVHNHTNLKVKFAHDDNGNTPSATCPEPVLVHFKGLTHPCKKERKWVFPPQVMFEWIWIKKKFASEMKWNLFLACFVLSVIVQQSHNKEKDHKIKKHFLK